MRDDDPQDAAQPDRYLRVAQVSAAVVGLPGVTVDQLPDPVFALDDNATLVYANDIAADVLGWRHEDFIGRPILNLIHPDDVNLAVGSMQTITGKSVGELIHIRVRSGDGAWVRLEIRGVHVPAADGAGGLTLLVARDTVRRHVLDLDQGDDAVLRAVMANMQGLVVLVDPDGNVRSVNGAVTRQLGHDLEIVHGQPFEQFLHPDDVEAVVEVVQRIPPHESDTIDARFATDDPTRFVVCEFTINNLIEDPVVRGYLISGQVATALADARNRVEFLALHDSRTGLLNRDGFIRDAGDLIRDGGGMGLLLLDVVRFRSINELYGEQVGDQILAAIAGRLDEIRWPGLLAARFGGDEFVLAVPAASTATVTMLEERVRRQVGEFIEVNGLQVSFAIRTAAAHEVRPVGLDSLLATASNEIVRLKQRTGVSAGSGGATGSVGAAELRQRRRRLEDLRRAIVQGDIRSFFQPIVGADGTVRSVEALVRWVHPIRGVLGVGEILPLARLAGLHELLDDLVLGQSLDFSRRLRDAGYPHVGVHVNVDPKVISEPTFATHFLQRCDEHGADPTQIVVELTENDLLTPGADALSNMSEIRDAGTRVSIDDFGTGYSSLSHLLDLPVDGMKIDRTFVAGIDVDTAATNLTKAIVRLSQSLGLGCVAEGVEQPYQRDHLAALGCDSFQGWLYAPAVSADALMELLPRIDRP